MQVVASKEQLLMRVLPTLSEVWKEGNPNVRRRIKAISGRAILSFLAFRFSLVQKYLGLLACACCARRIQCDSMAWHGMALSTGLPPLLHHDAVSIVSCLCDRRAWHPSRRKKERYNVKNTRHTHTRR